MKSSENFIEAIRQYLDSRAASDTLFAIRYASPSKSVAECCQYILNEVKRQGVSVLTNDEVYSLACHYFDGDVSAEEIGKPINCKVVISKDQLNLPGLFFAAQYSVTGQHEFTVVLGQVTPETRFCHFADTAYLTAGKLRGSVHLDRSAVFLLRLRPDAPETVALLTVFSGCLHRLS